MNHQVATFSLQLICTVASQFAIVLVQLVKTRLQRDALGSSQEQVQQSKASWCSTSFTCQSDEDQIDQMKDWAKNLLVIVSIDVVSGVVKCGRC